MGIKKETKMFKKRQWQQYHAITVKYNNSSLSEVSQPFVMVNFVEKVRENGLKLKNVA